MNQGQSNNRTVGIAIIVVVGVSAALILGTMSRKPIPASNVTSDTINISNYMFDPQTTTVAVGTKITWTNIDAVNHTITADAPSDYALSSMDIGKGSSYSFTFTKAGTYSYHCLPHPYMHGKIIVK